MDQVRQRLNSRTEVVSVRSTMEVNALVPAPASEGRGAETTARPAARPAAQEAERAEGRPQGHQGDDEQDERRQDDEEPGAAGTVVAGYLVSQGRRLVVGGAQAVLGQVERPAGARPAAERAPASRATPRARSSTSRSVPSSALRIADTFHGLLGEWASLLLHD